MSKSLWINRGRAAIALAAALACSGCERRSGEALVRGKEHIPVAEVAPSPGATPMDAPSSNGTIIIEESGPDVRGTSKDPRAIDRDQWIVQVEMVHDRRRIDVLLEEPRWNSLRVGDRVKVTYKVGKYTGTVWHARIE